MAREYHLDAPDGFHCHPTSSMATNVSLTFLMIPLLPMTSPSSSSSSSSSWCSIGEAAIGRLTAHSDSHPWGEGAEECDLTEMPPGIGGKAYFCHKTCWNHHHHHCHRHHHHFAEWFSLGGIAYNASILGFDSQWKGFLFRILQDCDSVGCGF